MCTEEVGFISYKISYFAKGESIVLRTAPPAEI